MTAPTETAPRGTITPHYRTVQQLLQSQTFAIDEYQREYKWETTHVDELLSDLVGKFEASYREGDPPKAVAGYEDYFLGSIIVTTRGGTHYLIDGQQRVTSLTLLLIYLHREADRRSTEAGHLGDTARAGAYGRLVSKITPLIFSDDFGEPRFNLHIPERLPVIRALFRGEPFTPDGHDESVRTIYERYGDIQARDLAGELGDAFPHFVYWLLAKVGLIEIATTNDAYAYAIFETMNDRGRPLSPVDMLKAFLLAPIETSEARREANGVWRREVYALTTWGGEQRDDRDASCIKAWLRAQYAESTRERRKGASDRDWELIGSVFHRWARDHAERLGLATEQGHADSEGYERFITEAFPFFARAYRRILDASETLTPGLESIFYVAHNRFSWLTTVLLAPLAVTDDDDTVRRKMQATATYLDIWVMRRVVNYVQVGYNPTSYAMWLLCRDIRRLPLADLVDTLVTRLHEEGAEIGFDGAPSRGRRGIAALGINQFSKRYIAHLLARLTAHVEVGAGRANPFAALVDRDAKNPFDIEHIWPDTYARFVDVFDSQHEFREARDRVGGLLLLPQDVNRSLQHKPYEQKLPVYAKQNAYAGSLAPGYTDHQPQLTRYADEHGLPLVPFEHFGVAEQDARTELVRQLAHVVWSPDRIREVL
ncbi:MAG: DUF262 domain-containing protein [Bacteroidota bacterium]